MSTTSTTSTRWDEGRRAIIRDALATHQWRAGAAAKYLGLSQSSMRHYIDTLGLQADYDEHKPGRGRPAAGDK